MILAIPFLTELLSGNMTVISIFTPINFLSLVVIGYGLPILAIRELAIRWNVGYFGIFIMGLAYGIFNEGILAKTLLLSNNVPISGFNNYIYYFGINFSWAPTIMVWHALHSVLFPILLTYFFFPNYASCPWLSKKTVFIMLIPVAILGLMGFFDKNALGIVGTLPHLIVFIVVMSAIFYLARMFKKEPENIPNNSFIKLTVTGFLFLIFVLIIPSIFADNKILPQIFFSYFFVMLLFFFFILRNTRSNYHSLLFTGLGLYIASAIFALIMRATLGNIPEVIAEIILIIIFSILIFKNKKKVLIIQSEKGKIYKL